MKNSKRSLHRSSNITNGILIGLVAIVAAVFINARTATEQEPRYQEVFLNNDTSIHRIYQIELSDASFELITLPKKASSLSIEWFDPEVPKSRLFFEGMGHVTMTGQASDNGPNHIFSRLVIPTAPFDNFLFQSGKTEQKVYLHVFFVPEIEVQPSSAKLAKNASLCSEPNWISYETWRKGLPDPKQGRVATEVRHCVVHHSAVLSNDTDYVKRVRNIYAFHTQSRGWDDIGYNFLVAPNGDLFGGRDPQGVADIDDVMGAHYCAKNSNTMGICMMGDYTSENISDTAQGSLVHLLTWKLYKSALNTSDSFIHPENTGEYLATIVGHRDGCATACPGNTFYPSLSKLRKRVQDELDLCISTSVNDLQTGNLKIWPNPVSDYLRISGLSSPQSKFIVHSMQGQKMMEGTYRDSEPIDVRALPEGTFVLTIGANRYKFAKTFR